MKPGPLRSGLPLLLASLLTGLSLADSSKFVELGGEHTEGRHIWMDTCASCHGYGIAGAPIPMRPNDWMSRLSTPMADHYAHAIDGFFGEEDTYMPPRGGNESLSDEEVRLAVDYMLALARFYINLKDNKQ